MFSGIVSGVISSTLFENLEMALFSLSFRNLNIVSLIFSWEKIEIGGSGKNI